LRIKDKEEAIIVRGCVIPCGLSDSSNDKPQTKEDIKKIFTNYLEHDTDVQHSWIRNLNVYTLENTLLDADTEIGGNTIPKDSWIASVMISNPDIKKMVSDGKLTGFSLGAVSDKGLNENQLLNKSLRYEDLNDSEELNPMFISLVDKPCHQLTWEVYDYKSFLAKSEEYNTISDNMTEEEKTITVSEGLFERLFGKLFMEKAEEPSEEPTEETEELEKSCNDKEEDKTEKAEAPSEKEEEEMEKAEPCDLSEETINAIADAVIEKIKALADEQTEEPKDDSVEVEVEKAEESDKEKEEEEMEKSVEPSEKEEVRLTKSTTKIVENNNTVVEPVGMNYRDQYGRNINYL